MEQSDEDYSGDRPPYLTEEEIKKQLGSQLASLKEHVKNGTQQMAEINFEFRNEFFYSLLIGPSVYQELKDYMVEESYRGKILESLTNLADSRVGIKSIKFLIHMGEILCYPGLKEEIQSIFKYATVYDTIQHPVVKGCAKKAHAICNNNKAL